MVQPQKPNDLYDVIRKYLFVALAIGTACLGIARAAGCKSIDLEVLWFFAAAGLLLVVDRIRELNISKEGGSVTLADFADLEKKVDEVETLAVDAAQALPGPEAPVRMLSTKWDLAGSRLPPITVADDPQKGRFGGQSERNGRRLSAEVRQSPNSSRFFEILLRVVSVGESTPITGAVVFYLHDTFRRPVRVVQVENGVAELQLLARGAFTVGVVADDGATLLELDLAQDVRFPKQFREA